MDIFCKIINGEMPSKKIFDDNDLMVIMDAFPERPGHVLIIPKKHYENILEMDAEIFSKVHEKEKEIIKKMENNIPSFDGCEVIINYGKPQMVKHFHMHIIPTYKGTNTLSHDEIFEILKGA